MPPVRLQSVLIDRPPGREDPAHPSPRGTLCGVLFLGIGLSFSSALPSCGSEPETSSATYSYVESNTGSGITVRSGEITVEFGPRVTYRSHSVLGTGENDVRETTVHGLPFEFSEGVITLGGERFEGLMAGDRVLIREDAILVNGKKRWDFPGR